MDEGVVLGIERCERRDVLVVVVCCGVGEVVEAEVGTEVGTEVTVAADSAYLVLAKVAPASLDLNLEGPQSDDRACLTLIEELLSEMEDPGLERVGWEEVLRSVAGLSLQADRWHSRELTGYRSLVD